MLPSFANRYWDDKGSFSSPLPGELEATGILQRVPLAGDERREIVDAAAQALDRFRLGGAWQKHLESAVEERVTDIFDGDDDYFAGESFAYRGLSNSSPDAEHRVRLHFFLRSFVYLAWAALQRRPFLSDSARASAWDERLLAPVSRTTTNARQALDRTLGNFRAKLPNRSNRVPAFAAVVLKRAGNSREALGKHVVELRSELADVRTSLAKLQDAIEYGATEKDLITLDIERQGPYPGTGDAVAEFYKQLAGVQKRQAIRCTMTLRGLDIYDYAMMLFDMGEVLLKRREAQMLRGALKIAASLFGLIRGRSELPRIFEKPVSVRLHSFSKELGHIRRDELNVYGRFGDDLETHGKGTAT